MKHTSECYTMFIYNVGKYNLRDAALNLFFSSYFFKEISESIFSSYFFKEITFCVEHVNRQKGVAPGKVFPVDGCLSC